MRRSRKLPALNFGRLPAELINQTIGTDLTEADVIMSYAAQRHAARRHREYASCVPFIAAIICNPQYIGDDFKNSGIELIGYANSSLGYILIAVELEVDKLGRYNVSSVYPVSRSKINNRRTKGFLKIAVKKWGLSDN